MKEKNVLEFYLLCNNLKTMLRQGWKTWQVNSDRIESIAEHIFGTQMLAIAIFCEYNYANIDLKKSAFDACHPRNRRNFDWGLNTL